MSRLGLIGLVLLLNAGCWSFPEDRLSSDGGQVDTVPDTGTIKQDASDLDAPPADAPLHDSPLPDASLSDTLSPDASLPDALLPDTGTVVFGNMISLPPQGTAIPVTFTMGSLSSEPCRDDNETQHQVTLTHRFEIAAYETSQGQFAALMGYNPADFGPNGNGTDCGSNCPVEQVSWHEAVAYCNALSDLAGLTQCYSCSGSGSSVSCTEAADHSGAAIYDCPGFRLPTDAEWEYAYRAGVDTAFYSGPMDSSLCQECSAIDPNASAVGWYCANSNSTTHPAGKKQVNAWGLYDMAGNVWEWCHDRSVEDLGSAAVTDPWGSSGGSERVIRGGSWSDQARFIRAAERDSDPPSSLSSKYGFRCARTTCGNGIIDADEECDGGDCCTSDCTLATAGTECRASLGECDPAETCSGISDACPADAHQPDGWSCTGGGTCQDGVCSPAAGYEALFVASGTSLSASDNALRNRMVANGYTVEVADDDDSQATLQSKAAGKNVVVISESVISATLGTKLTSVAVGVVVFEFRLYDEMQMASSSGTSGGQTLDIVAPGHALAAGLSGTRTVYSSCSALGGTSSLGTGATVIAESGGQAVVFGYEAGSQMIGMTAPARRAGLFIYDGCGGDLSGDGLALFDAAVDWAAGKLP